MCGLLDFANGGGLGMSHPNDIFAWNRSLSTIDNDTGKFR